MFLSTWLRKLAAHNPKSSTRSKRKQRPSDANRQRPWLEVFEERTLPAIFTVNIVDDPLPPFIANDGIMSLREAILLANGNGTGSDSITFNIPGFAPHQLTLNPLQGALPAITGDLVIDGTTQPGYTFGVPAILVTRATMSDEQVYGVVKAVMDDLPAMRRLHPALANLRAEEMVPKPELAPIHPGALRYFRENNLVD